MAKAWLRKYNTAVCVILAILMAMILRQISRETVGLMSWFCAMLRSMLYIGLFMGWGVSLGRRIVQTQVRRYLVAIAGLMVFWVTVRTIRFMFAQSPWVLRELWYLYYLPMLFIPCLAVFVALSLGKPDNFRLPEWTVFLYIPAVALLVLVLTNDWHQLVFVFPADAAVWGNVYHYGIGYFLAVGWMVLCTVTALGIMLLKCRVPYSRRVLFLPFVPVVLAMVYCVCWVLRVLGVFQMPWLKVLAGDMTVVFCLLFAAVLECSIQCGLIQSNTGYDELFMVSRLGAQITDQEHVVCLASHAAKELTEEQRILAGGQTVQIDHSTLVRSQPISFGHVLWQEDITDLAEAIEQIEENCHNLEERNRIRQENLETRRKILALQEKNRVTDLLHKETAGQIGQINRMLAQYDREADDKKRRKLLARVAVTGAYIKRYGNLLLLTEHRKTADIQELSRCLEESFASLELLDVRCLHTLSTGSLLATKDMLHVYRSFETVVEACIEDLQAVWINEREEMKEIFLHMEVVCRTDLSRFSSIADAFSHEDEAYRFTFRLQKGGEK